MSKLTLGRPFDGKLVFYSSLFQAGIDRLVIVDRELGELVDLESYGIPSRRQHIVQFEESKTLRNAVRAYFDNYLDPGWSDLEKNRDALLIYTFLCELLTSFRLKKPLLNTLAFPDLAPLQGILPLEVLLPIQTLFGSIAKYESVVAMPTGELNKDRMQVIDEIMASDPYQELEQIHGQLGEASSGTEACLIGLEKVSKDLYWRWKDFLRLKSTVIRIARGIPDIVEAFAGEKAGGVAKALTTVLAEVLRREHGQIVYEGFPLLQESLVGLALQMIRVPLPDIDRRMKEFQREREGSAKNS